MVLLFLPLRFTGLKSGPTIWTEPMVLLFLPLCFTGLKSGPAIWAKASASFVKLTL
jgi:hypothetical protein